MRNMWQRLMGCGILVLLFSMRASGELQTSILRGVLVDSTGARISAVTLELQNLHNGAVIHDHSDATGGFYFANLPADDYMLRISSPGFANASVPDLHLHAGEGMNLVLRLAVGPITQSISISAADAMIQADQTALESTLQSKEIKSLILNGKGTREIMESFGGVAEQSPQARYNSPNARGGLAVHGQRYDENVIYVDGISTAFGTPLLEGVRLSPSYGGQTSTTALGSTNNLATLDEVADFRFHLINPTAEYAGAGSVLDLATASGTSQSHGNIFERYRDFRMGGVTWFGGNAYNDGGVNVWAAADSFAQVPFRETNYGMNLGGMVRITPKISGLNRFYYHSSAEFLRLNEPTGFEEFFALPEHVYDATPAKLQPTILYLIDVDNITDPMGFYADMASMPGEINTEDLRIDRSNMLHSTLSLRWSTSTSHADSMKMAQQTKNHLLDHWMSANLFTAFSSQRSNSLSVGWANEYRNRVYRVYGSVESLPNDGYPFLPTGLAPASVPSVLCAHNFISVRIPDYGAAEVEDGSVHAINQQWNVRDNFDWNTGKHELRSGVEFRQLSAVVLPASLNLDAEYYSIANVEANQTSDAFITWKENANPIFHQYAAYVDEKWRVHSNLVLNAGVRWQADPAPHGADGKDAYTLLGDLKAPTSLHLAARGHSLWQTDYLRFSPHLGVAWSHADDAQWSNTLHAGVGLYLQTANAAAASAFTAYGFASTREVNGLAIPVTSVVTDANTNPDEIHALAYLFPRNLQSPYAIEWSADVEQHLGHNQILNLSWVGVSAQHQLEEQRRMVSVANTKISEVATLAPSVSAMYNAMLVRFNRQLSHGFSATASYTWSHATDWESTAPIYPLLKGDADNDLRQSLHASLTFSLPSSNSNFIARSITRGWSASSGIGARSAFPVALFGNLEVDKATGEHHWSGVDFHPNRPFYLESGSYPGGRAVNGGPSASAPAFTLPAVGTAGNAPRNIVRGFGEYQWDASVHREFSMYRRLHAEFDVSGFNLTNHPNYGYVDPILSEKFFGQALVQLNQSAGNAGSLYETGAPRSFLGKLKISF